MSVKTDPFELLVGLARQGMAHARGLPARREVAATWTGIGFVLAGQRMIAPMSEVAELIPMPNATPLPGVRSWVQGVANVRGRLLPLIDLEAFFGGQLIGASKGRRVLAVEKDDLYTGLVVGEVVGMLHFPAAAFLPKVPRQAEPFSQYSQGSYVQEGSTWTVFSPYRLLRDHRFINAAA